MAYRRKHGTLRASTFEDFSQSSAFFNQNPVHHEHSSLRITNERGTNESKYGLWGILARKAKSFLEDDSVSQQFNNHGRNEFQMLHTSTGGQFSQPNLSSDNTRKSENLASPLNQIGGTIKSALEEGLTIVENRAADIIQETKKIQIRRKTAGFNPRGQVADLAAIENHSQNLSDQENRLKPSQDVRPERRNAGMVAPLRSQLIQDEVWSEKDREQSAAVLGPQHHSAVGDSCRRTYQHTTPQRCSGQRHNAAKKSQTREKDRGSSAATLEW